MRQYAGHDRPEPEEDYEMSGDEHSNVLVERSYMESRLEVVSHLVALRCRPLWKTTGIRFSAPVRASRAPVVLRDEYKSY